MFYFPHIGNVIIPIDELIVFRGVGFNHQPVVVLLRLKLDIEGSAAWSPTKKSSGFAWGKTTDPLGNRGTRNKKLNGRFVAGKKNVDPQLIVQ